MAVEIVILGGGGHALVVTEILSMNLKFQLLGFIDPNKNAVLSRYGIDWLGSDEELEKGLFKFAHVGVGYVKDERLREELYARGIKLGLQFPPLISGSAVVSKLCSIQDGSLIVGSATINAGAKIGCNSIINTGSIIEHGVQIGNHCHIAPNATILGDAKIGDGSFIGSGAIICPGIEVGSYANVGAGLVINREVAECEIKR